MPLTVIAFSKESGLSPLDELERVFMGYSCYHLQFIFGRRNNRAIKTKAHILIKLPVTARVSLLNYCIPFPNSMCDEAPYGVDAPHDTYDNWRNVLFLRAQVERPN